MSAQRKLGHEPTSHAGHQEADIIEALKASPAAHAKYQALPPSHKDEYVKWIGEAKKPETRSRRIAGMITKLTSE